MKSGRISIRPTSLRVARCRSPRARPVLSARSASARPLRARAARRGRRLRPASASGSSSNGTVRNTVAAYIAGTTALSNVSSASGGVRVHCNRYVGDRRRGGQPVGFRRGRRGRRRSGCRRCLGGDQRHRQHGERLCRPWRGHDEQRPEHRADGERGCRHVGHDDRRLRSRAAAARAAGFPSRLRVPARPARSATRCTHAPTTAQQRPMAAAR